MRQFIIQLFSLAVLCLSLPQVLIAADNEQRIEAQAANHIPTTDIKRFVTTIAVIRHYYIKSVNDEKLFNNAISGMVTSLDPHSAFLNAQALKELHIATDGEFSGVGIELTPNNGMLEVITPIDGSPAAKAGIKPGDLIVAINGKLVRNLSLDEAIRQIRGKRNSKLVLTIARTGRPKPIDITLIRQKIQLKAVKSRLLAPGYAYVRLAIFQSNANKQINRAIKALKKKSNNQLKGLVLDLRNNPGGLLDAGTAVANTFLDSKQITHRYRDLIVYTKGRAKGSQLEISATPNDAINGVPMVVLINQGSASAAEIVAGALQDYNRAIVMGTRSFGKGSVQTILPIDNKEAVKLTTALYYTPAGREIQARGIEPDVVTPKLKIDTPTQSPLTISEASLMDHLKNHSKNKMLKKSSKQNDTTLAQKDYQLYEALIMLRGIDSLNR